MDRERGERHDSARNTGKTKKQARKERKERKNRKIWKGKKKSICGETLRAFVQQQLEEEWPERIPPRCLTDNIASGGNE